MSGSEPTVSEPTRSHADGVAVLCKVVLVGRVSGWDVASPTVLRHKALTARGNSGIMPFACRRKRFAAHVVALMARNMF